MAKYWEFEVSGSGDFPHDMLRYDACYPANPAAVNGIAPVHTDTRSREFMRDIRTVRLISHVKAPTDGRWESFGWRVTRSVAMSR